MCKHDTYGISFAVDYREPGGLSAEGMQYASIAADLAAASGADGAVSIGDAAAGSQRDPSASTLPASDAGGSRRSTAHRSRPATAVLPAGTGVPLKVIKSCWPVVTVVPPAAICRYCPAEEQQLLHCRVCRVSVASPTQRVLMRRTQSGKLHTRSSRRSTGSWQRRVYRTRSSTARQPRPLLRLPAVRMTWALMLSKPRSSAPR